MAKRHILQLIGDLDPGGAENVVANLANGLQTSGYDVTICSRKTGSLIQRLHNVPVLILPKRRSVDLRYLLKFTLFLHHRNIDLVHSHLFGNNLYGFLASLLTGRKSILTIHGEDCFASKKRMIFYRLVAPFVSRIIAVSKSLHNQLTQDLCIKEEKVTLIPNGIDTARFQKKIDLIYKKKKLGLPTDAPLIGAIGNIKPVKGYDIFLEAAVSVKQKFPEACFIIVGGVYQYKEYMKELEVQTWENDLQNQVYFLGKRDDVEEILPLLTVYVLPSRSEGSPIALLEAMASGRPIVATGVGGIPDIIENDISGLLIPPADPSSMANAIIQLLENQSMAKKMGEHAQRVVEECYSVNSMVEKYLILYDEVLNAKDIGS